jgi:hypothetical protein
MPEAGSIANRRSEAGNSEGKRSVTAANLPDDGTACESSPDIRGESAVALQREDNLVLDLLVELGDGSVPLRGLAETLFSLTAEVDGKEAGSGASQVQFSETGVCLPQCAENTPADMPEVFSPASGLRHSDSIVARVTRMALLHHNGEMVNPLGERKRLWER